LAESTFIHTVVSDSGLSGTYDTTGLTVKSYKAVVLNFDGSTSITFDGDVTVQVNARLQIQATSSNPATLKTNKTFIIGAKTTGARVNIDDPEPEAGLISFGAYELTNTGSSEGKIKATGNVEFKGTTITLGSEATHALSIGTGLKLGNQAAGSGVYTFTPSNYYGSGEPVEFDAGGAGKITVPGIYDVSGTAGELALSPTAEITLGAGSIVLGYAGTPSGLNGKITLDNGALLAGLSDSFHDETGDLLPPPPPRYIVGIMNETNGGTAALFSTPGYYNYVEGDSSRKLAPTTQLSLIPESTYRPFVISGSTKIVRYAGE
jgi:hypothetical protein